MRCDGVQSRISSSWHFVEWYLWFISKSAVPRGYETLIIVAYLSFWGIDVPCRRLPQNHNTRHFSIGMLTLSRVSGQNVSHPAWFNRGPSITRQSIGYTSSMLCPSNSRLSIHLPIPILNNRNTGTARRLTYTVSWQQEHLGIRTDFNIPKIHSLQHYVASIKLFGATDNYNTE
jgi:hypothetical protein